MWATDYLDVLRTPDGTADDYGYPDDTDTLIATGVPASVSQSTTGVRSPGSGETSRVVRYTIRVPAAAGLAFRQLDRLRSVRAGVQYIVDEIDQNSDNPAAIGESVFRCRRVT